MITAEQARNNKAEYHNNVELKLQAEALEICEEKISPLIENASCKGADKICYKFENCSAGVSSRVISLLEAAKYGVRLENGGKCVTISW